MTGKIFRSLAAAFLPAGPAKLWTGGCVAIPEARMLFVMHNVRPDCAVVIDSLEKLGGKL